MKIDAETLLQRFRDCRALLDGHFLLSSGLHSPQYFQCALLFDDPRFGRTLGEALAQSVREAGCGDVSRIVGPALGGVIAAYELAAALGARNAFAERGADGRMTLRRGFEVTQGERVIVCEDVVTTGGSADEVVKMLRALGANPVAVACVVDRSSGETRLDVPLTSLVRAQVQTFDPAACPLCAEGSNAVKPGSRPTP
ncbi:MAG: orotate phosphoribosyltransferase [Proteobacteria bacterium]|nr:orotate phosphoribosyltransferase [Pseudomonadota bacterium]